MKARPWKFGAVLLCLLLPLQVAGQDSAPDEQHRQLEPLVGSWEVAITYRFGNGPERHGTASCKTTWILDHRFLEQRYESRFGNRPFQVLQILGYDNGRKKFFELKMDNLDNGLLHNEGAISADGKVLSFQGDRIDPMTGKVGRLRTVTTVADADHYTLDWYQLSPDGKEQKTVSMQHTRKKP